MSLKINITDDFKTAFDALDKFQRKELKQAARTAIRRSLVTMRKELTIMFKKEVRLKSSFIKSQIITKMHKSAVTGRGLVSGSLLISTVPLPLIEFVRGSKERTSQKGIPVKRRKKVRVEIKPGNRFVVRGGWIGQTQSRGLQVLRRGRAQGHLKMQVGPSLGAILLSDRRGVTPKVLQLGQETFTKNLKRELNFRLQRLANKQGT